MLELFIPTTIGFMGTTSIVIISIVALILFGPKKLPQFGRSIGSTLKEFKDATKGLADDDDDYYDRKRTERIEVKEVKDSDERADVEEVKEVKEVKE